MLKKLSRAAADRDCFIFDVDGVLLDVQRSFPSVIRRCVEDSWQESGRGRIEDGYPRVVNELLKRHGSFNDDYDIAWALLNIAAHLSHMPSEQELAEAVSTCTGSCVPWLRGYCAERFEREAIRRRCEDLYFGTGESDGAYRLEVPLLSRRWDELRLPAYIYTGRDMREWKVAAEMLGWADMPDERVAHRGIGMLKPSPAGIDYICEHFGHAKPMMFGDTMSDMKAAAARDGCAFVAIGRLLEGAELRCESIELAMKIIMDGDDEREEI